MFGAMMKGIAQDFVRYVMHVQVVAEPASAAARRADGAERADDSSSDDDARPSGFDRAARGCRGRPRATCRRAGRTGAGADQAGDRRQGRVVEDAAQRAVPVRVGQEVQDVPRRRLSARATRHA